VLHDAAAPSPPAGGDGPLGGSMAISSITEAMELDPPGAHPRRLVVRLLLKATPGRPLPRKPAGRVPTLCLQSSHCGRWLANSDCLCLRAHVADIQSWALPTVVLLRHGIARHFPRTYHLLRLRLAFCQQPRLSLKSDSICDHHYTPGPARVRLVSRQSRQASDYLSY